LVQQQDEIIAAAMQQVWHQVKLQSGKVTDGSLNVSQGHSQDTRLIWPEKNAVVTQGFGPSSLKLEPPFEGFPHFHSGVDMALPLGTPVVAADDGVVLLVGQDPLGYGTYIVLGHRDGLTTLYGHLSAAEVKAMDQVIQGQPIGLEGSTGNSTGPHLHFELRVGGDPVDPALYLPPPYVAAPG
jgi:murein DD-endopeptidase MepM/ murein hydrolase activator NlpD